MQKPLRISLEIDVRRLQPTIADLKRTCKEGGTDLHGFFFSSKGYSPEFKLGKEGMDRGLRILDALAKAAERRGHRVVLDGEHLRFIVNDEPLSVCMHETTIKAPHTPTKAEVQAQAQHDRWSTPSTYSDGTPRTVYPRWDYLPSGKLRLDIYDPHDGRYGHSQEARWIERGSGRIDEKLNDIMATLVVEAEMARQRRLEREEAARKAAEEAERRRIAAARAERVRRVHKLFDEAARNNARLLRLESLRQTLEREDLTQYQAMLEELNGVIERARKSISAATLDQALAEIPELPDPEPAPLYPWQRRY